ncbi:MAG TPA: V4R domain-containing protein [Anaerolineales bacterium]|nr:V4R domain-containing protein [Anaerolineales bacterium]
MGEVRFPNRILRRFVEIVTVELGVDQLHAMLALAKLSPDWANPQTFLKTNPVESAKTYAAMQAAMRTYYGRGARGVLLRVGQRLWNLLLEDAALGGKTQAALIRRLPLATRHKLILELMARLIGAQSGDMTVHTLDLDLLVVDYASPTAQDHYSAGPICFVTQGLIRESLFWATGKNFDVEETSCKATGHNTCDFKITAGRSS